MVNMSSADQCGRRVYDYHGRRTLCPGIKALANPTGQFARLDWLCRRCQADFRYPTRVWASRQVCPRCNGVRADLEEEFGPMPLLWQVDPDTQFMGPDGVRVWLVREVL